MKTERLLILILFIGGITFNSFGQKFTLTKRHYKSGYYIQTNDKKVKKNRQQKEDVEKNDKVLRVENERVKKQEKKSDVPITKKENDDTYIASNGNDYLTDNAITKKNENDNISQSNYNEKKNYKINKKLNQVLKKLGIENNPVKQIVNATKELKKSYYSTESPDPKPDKLAKTSMILGIIGLFIFGIILGLLALIFGAVSLGRISKNPDLYSGKGQAIAGLILGIIGLVGMIVLLVVLLTLFV